MCLWNVASELGCTSTYIDFNLDVIIYDVSLSHKSHLNKALMSIFLQLSRISYIHLIWHQKAHLCWFSASLYSSLCLMENFKERIMSLYHRCKADHVTPLHHELQRCKLMH